MPLVPYLNVAQIVVAVCLIIVVLLQSRGTGFASGFSSDSSIFRTRRGFELVLFQFTIGLAVVFVLLAIASVFVARFEL
ncbi:MAG: preprotein translocase subunit SecG [Chloroflexi bacterium]|nr:preprotein translocase subunit SecG [Chloroflexota bacterium]